MYLPVNLYFILAETASAHNNPKKDGRTRAPALELLNPNRTICALDFSERIHYNIKEFGVQPQTDFFKSVEAYRSGHNGLDSKSSKPLTGPVGSNPTFSAKEKRQFSTEDCRFFLTLHFSLYPFHSSLKLSFPDKREKVALLRSDFCV